MVLSDVASTPITESIMGLSISPASIFSIPRKASPFIQVVAIWDISPDAACLTRGELSSPSTAALSESISASPNSSPERAETFDTISRIATSSLLREVLSPSKYVVLSASKSQPLAV